MFANNIFLMGNITYEVFYTPMHCYLTIPNNTLLG